MRKFKIKNRRNLTEEIRVLKLQCETLKEALKKCDFDCNYCANACKVPKNYEPDCNSCTLKCKCKSCFDNSMWEYDNSNCNDLNRLSKLVKADKNGRCEVLPCKIGDIVYFTKNYFGQQAKKPIPSRVCRITLTNDDVLFKALSVGYNLERMFNTYNIGKTVFLAYDEAEKALQENN